MHISAGNTPNMNVVLSFINLSSEPWALRAAVPGLPVQASPVGGAVRPALSGSAIRPGHDALTNRYKERSRGRAPGHEAPKPGSGPFRLVNERNVAAELLLLTDQNGSDAEE